MLRVCHYNDRRHSSDSKRTKIVVKHFLGDKRIGVNLYVKKLTEIYFFGGCAKNRKSLFLSNRCLSVYHNSNRCEVPFRVSTHQNSIEKHRSQNTEMVIFGGNAKIGIFSLFPILTISFIRFCYCNCNYSNKRHKKG